VFLPLEWTLREDRPKGVNCMAKVVVHRGQGGRVLGMHIAAPNAGEIIQGFAVAFRKGTLTHQVPLLSSPRHLPAYMLVITSNLILLPLVRCVMCHIVVCQDLLDTVGIHPTVAEEFTELTISKASGAPPTQIPSIPPPMRARL
jgi:thioredoxin reductase (NADPH)